MSKNSKNHEKEGYTPMPEQGGSSVSETSREKKETVQEKKHKEDVGVSHADSSTQDLPVGRAHDFQQNENGEPSHAAVDNSLSVAVGAFVIVTMLIVGGVLVFYQSGFLHMLSQNSMNNVQFSSQNNQAQVVEALPDVPPTPPTPPPYADSEE